ncbi:MAG: transglutaminase domain-containing protein [Deltaproteobacteria bacterium]|nr:transglutaminase domain-containing protein [Deltaproteobacteria bacterium]
MRRALTFALVATWVVMVALLVRRQAPAPASDGATLPAAATDERDEWFGVYHSGDKVGHAHRVTAHTADGYAFYEDSVIALAMLGTPQTLRTALATETDGDYALRRFRFTLISPATAFSATGTSDDHVLVVRYGPKGQEADLRLPLTEPIYLPSTLRPRVLAGIHTPGTRYTVPVFSPLALRNEPMTITIDGLETIDGPNGPVATVRLAEEHQGLQAHAWIDAAGGVVREEGALGFTLARETEEQALAPARGAPIDLAVVSEVPLEGDLADARGAARLTLRVSGEAAARIPDDGRRQRLHGDLLRITREELPAPVALPLAVPTTPEVATAVGAAPFLEVDDPTLAARARSVVGDAHDTLTAARRLVTWVAEAIDKAPTVTVPSAREVLASRRGDCNEHAVLLVALARAAGIPARLVAGVVYAGDGFYYHAWTELWLGEWVSADSVFDQMPVDATHVKLVEGGPEQQIALAGMIGKLAFRVEEDER